MEVSKSFNICVGASSSPSEGISCPELNKLLEGNDEQTKLKAMKDLLIWSHNGSVELLTSYDRLYMTVVRFVAPCRNHDVHRLVQLYWEVAPQTTTDGVTMRPEMLLVSNLIRNDLQHSNEYVRGATLRNLAKIASVQLLNTVFDCITANLVHNHAYVRRNAAMCIYALASRLNRVATTALSDLEHMALTEIDVATQRAAILALTKCDPISAAKLFLLGTTKSLSLGECGHLAILSLIRDVWQLMAHSFPPTQTSFALNQLLTKDSLVERLKELLDLANSDSVVYEASKTLLWLTDFSTNACKLACKGLVKTLLSQKDVNVRINILENLISISRKSTGVLGPFISDILRVLTAPSLQLRTLTLLAALPSVNNQNVQAAVNAIRIELVKTMDVGEGANRLETQKLLVQAMRYLATKFPEIAESVIDLLLDFLGDRSSSFDFVAVVPTAETSVQIAHLVRELLVVNASLRPKILRRLNDCLGEITSSRALRMCIWVLGELCDTQALAQEFINSIYLSLKPFPLSTQTNQENQHPVVDSQPRVTVRTVVMPDGAYGIENVYDNNTTPNNANGLRALCVKSQDSLFTAVLGVALTKVTIRSCITIRSGVCLQEPYNKTLLIIGSLIKLYTSDELFGPSSDVVRRLSACLNCIILQSVSQIKKHDLFQDSHLIKHHHDGLDELAHAIAIEKDSLKHEELSVIARQDEVISNLEIALWKQDRALKEMTQTAIEDLLSFRSICDVDALRGGTGTTFDHNKLISDVESKDDVEFDRVAAMNLAIKGTTAAHNSSMSLMMRSNKAKPLSGTADPIYVECVMQVNHLDLIIEFMISNRTTTTLQNIGILLGAHGDLKILERPHPVTLAPGDQTNVFCTVKLTSAEAGVIFGYCGYERKSSLDKDYFALNEITVDILDCIQKAYIGNFSFRSLWADFEWENKISIQIRDGRIVDFLALLLKQTNMTVVGIFDDSLADQRDAKDDLTEITASPTVDNYIRAVTSNQAIQDLAKSNVFAINLCSKSIFGEDALVNLSLEKGEKDVLIGAVRIRSRTQGIALSLGDCIAASQRAHAAAATVFSSLD